jgi:DNA-binding transcriptional LysR family regulator
MRFDLTDLRLFLAVVDAGSITHGAAAAGLSLAAASERLRDMETIGEVALLDRGRRGVSATEAGDALAHHARMILRQVSEMHGELGEYARGLRSSISVLANTAATSEHLPERLGPWMALHPQVDIQLKERQSVEIARSLTAGHAEIGILSAMADTTGLTARPFATDRLVIVAAEGHLLAGKARISFAELMGEYFIGLAGGALQEHVDAQAAKIGAKLKFRIRLHNFEAVCRMAGAGVGIGVVPEKAARRLKRSAKVAVIRLADEWATRRLLVCASATSEPTAQAQSLFRHLGSDPE